MLIDNFIYFGFVGIAYVFTFSCVTRILFKAASISDKSKRRTRVRKALMLSLLLLCLPLTPYFVVEIQTRMLARPLMNSVRQAIQLDGIGGPILMLKVLRVRPESVTVYVIEGTRACSGGQTYDFKRSAQGWIYERYYDTIYSNCGGNADGNVFPPYFRGDEDQ